MAKVIPFPLKNLRPLRVRVVWPNGRENEECSLFILTLPFQDIDQALDVAWKIASLGHEPPSKSGLQAKERKRRFFWLKALI